MTSDSGEMVAEHWELWPAARALAVAVLIGLLVGVQREVSLEERRPGVRDFVLIGAVGGICGLLGMPWLTGVSLLSLTLLLVAFHLKAALRSGVTTELAAVATFAMGYLATVREGLPGASLAIALAIVITAFLEAKRNLHRFLRESVTEAEFNATLRFLAVIFLVYPLLPDGHFGPYGGLHPKGTWLFVILVSSISYAGYFFNKFLGSRRGLAATAVLGGLASTTAATASFARMSKENPEESVRHAAAAVLANATQFPRLAALLLLIAPGFGAHALPLLSVMAAAGLATALLLSSRTGKGAARSVTLGNPFALLPALKFGAIFTAVLFVARYATGAFGGEVLYWTAFVGGSADVDAVAFSLADLLQAGHASAGQSLGALLVAIGANAVLKLAISFSTAPRRFTLRLAAGFLVMFAAGIPWLFLH